ncbi:BTAD domain-containing putative transcriptional regulator [Gordonia polyisoprenivorans]|uniref:BTAD domain-containing putative transcriptional regulator n=1 Tax=Gordonia polyisoprenivorans TaxID=84595 RepID=UPI001AD74F04|nr:BTAD domain-containing putative transcriptional regulator [Gordonia polyisoprenivorans]QTI71047.1 winged helix-turn-helix domain-containing protein [Gordonia polyisoprenivorans]
MAHDGEVIIGLLGPVSVIAAPHPDSDSDGPQATPVPGLRAKRLLTSLALADGRTRSAERLIDDVWGDDAPRSPTSALHTQISRLRQLLGADHLQGSGSGYRLVGCRTDLDVVTEMITSTDDAERAAIWWRGTPGDDLGTEEPGGLIDELTARARQVADRLDRSRYTAAMAAGDDVTARSIAEKRCLADPLDESAHLDLMRALAAAGRVADAIAVYTGLRRRLSAELGVDPGAQISALHTQLLSGTDTSAPAPAPASAETPRTVRRGRGTGLLADTTELIGRDGDVDAIVSAIETSRVVTIQGPGGVGKTRVANRVGHHLVDAGASVFYVPLAPIRADDDVVPAIAAALGVGESDLSRNRPRMTVGDLHDRLLDAVRGRDAVLILDNCEQVIDRCAQVVADLLAADDHIRILVTSRSPLMLASERIHLLPTLDARQTGPAVQLFVTRARAVRPDALLPPDRVAALCRHLDGLPLAIELAAARIRTMTVEEIADRLVERFALLRGADRSAPDRHRTLYAVIDWSWELLDEDARIALCRLCRFPGGFTTDAGATVLGYSGFRLDDTLAALVNQSLLEVTESGGRVRYRMLETVREFGEGKLGATPEGSEEVDQRMWRWAREFCVDAAARYDEGIDDVLLGAVAADAENLVWVLRSCLDRLSAGEPSLHSGAPTDTFLTVIRVFPVLAGLWMARGLHAEVLNWGTRILAVAPTPPRTVADDVRRDWEASLLAALAHQVMRRDLRALAKGRYHLRLLHRPDHAYDEQTDLIAACALSRTALEAMRHIVRGTRAAEERVATAAMAARMNIRENMGDLEGALRDGATLQKRAEANGDTWMSAMVEISVGSVLGQQMLWRDAVGHYRRGIVELVRLGAYEDEMQTRTYLVVTLIALGEMDSAATELEVVSDGWTPDQPDPQGSPEIGAALMLAHAEFRFAKGDTEVAGDLYRRAGELVRREHPLGGQDPGALMMVSVAVIGLMRAGLTELARGYLPILGDGVAATFSALGWHDSPQAGAMALAAGYVLSADPQTRGDGARLMVLSQRLRARRDYPGFVYTVEHMQELSGLTDEEWQAHTGPVADLPRRQAAARLQAILASRRADGAQALRI